MAISSSLHILRLQAGAVIRFSLFAGVAMGSAQTAVEPEQAGPDFRIQGEYIGVLASADTLALQIMAMGNGDFQGLFLPGGLPGQGWNGQEKTAVSGSLQSDFTGAFSGNGYTATIPADGKSCAGKTPGNASFTLTKVYRESPTLDAAAPTGAVILFDGTDVAAWMPGTATKDDRNFLKPEGLSESSGATTIQRFQSFTLHMEFREPFMPTNRGQSRGNSGIYLQGRDELQILDSFGIHHSPSDTSLSPKEECGAFFQYFRPLVNMALPPLAWQTFDVDFTAARYDAGGVAKLETAYATVRMNGVIIHNQVPLQNSTLLGDPQGSTPGPLRFQAYNGSPVFYRNIWITTGSSSIKPSLHRTRSEARSPENLARAGTRLDGRRIQFREPTGMRLWEKINEEF